MKHDGIDYMLLIIKDVHISFNYQSLICNSAIVSYAATASNIYNSFFVWFESLRPINNLSVM